MNYVFRAEFDGICATCLEDYDGGSAVVLTADGVVHPGCEE